VVWSEFPLGEIAVSAFAIWLIVRQGRARITGARLVILIAFALVSWASLYTIRQPFDYYMGFWLVLVAVLGAGIHLPRFLDHERAGVVRSVAAGCALALLVFPNLQIANEHSSKFLWTDLRTMRTFLDLARERTVLMFNPEHPIFVANATRLYTRWQFRFIKDAKDLEVMTAPGEPGFVDSILAKRPAIISRDGGTLDFLSVLKSRGLISDGDWERLEEFLASNYSARDIARQRYWIANDRALMVP